MGNASFADKPSMRGRMGKAVADLLPRAIVVRQGNPLTRRVALTFDDGPDEHTRAYLDLLDRLDARATFFLIGAACLARPDDVRAIVARGHEVASHGFTHRPFPSLDRRALRDELSRAQRSLLPSERSRPFVRPPRGATTARSLVECAAAGYQTVLWSLDSDDCRTQDSAVIAAKLSTATAGDIVLLHEGQSWTLAALPRIVEELRARGLEPGTVSDVL
ncbi:MAG: polysaccharide deacetylase family protein [Polyangiales bacterium]